ncbi:MAG: hypothetical protein JSV18_00060 [Candidatus Bathyarchaeota archaeon]|nr:MAG: hypothetical protein JSV18_00060 [Candidatus Bathyarchaeota archaeon]
MKQQTLGIFLCILVAASICGVGYSQWNDVIEIHTEMRFGTLTLRFVGSPVCSDNDDDTKNIGVSSCEYTDPDLATGGYKTLEATVTNTYPGYEAYCTFTLQNVGTLPEQVVGITMTPGTGLKIGDTYVDADGRLVGWRLDDEVTDEPILNVYIYDDAGSSLVSQTLDSLELLPGELTIYVEQSAEQCHTYSFEVEITYE